MARTVLLADDSVTAQNMGRRILMDAGYEVVTVNNGSAALKKIHESHPDLIVLDVYMPGYGGLEVCQRLKDTDETARIPVLLSVGKMEPFKAEEARRVRADGHIVKPFEASELLAALTKLEDRIVPQADSSNGRRGKPEKRSRLWRAEDPLASAEEPLTDRVAYLAEAKKRRAQNAEVGEEESEAPATQEDSTAASIDRSGKAAARPTVAEVQVAEFAVEEPVTPPESSDEITRAVGQAAETAPSFDASTVETATAQTPTGEVSAIDTQVNESPVPQVNASEEAIAEELAPEVNVEQPLSSGATPPLAGAASPVSAARWIAENVALSVEEAAIALEAEMQQAQATSAGAVGEGGIRTEATASSDEPGASRAQSAEKENANSSAEAFTAAASASSAAVVSSQYSGLGIEPAQPSTQGEAEPAVPSDATAAWANWQQIRDSVMSPQKAAEIAESVAAIADAGLPMPESSTREESSSITQTLATTDSVPATPAVEDNSLNEIVDSVLADLKPRLMQEIAKKLAAKK